MAARLLLIDNRDSFVWNLAQALLELGRATGRAVDVHRCDRTGGRARITELVADCEAVVLSPGPGRPAEAGALLDVVAAAAALRRPTLGVCLGHQAIGEFFGAPLVRATPCHGERSTIDHDGDGVLAGLPNPVGFARYHSLVLDRDRLPSCLVENARTDPGAPGGRLCMAIRHRELPMHGVQFHPESFLCGEAGRTLLGTFLAALPAAEAAAR